MAWRNGKAITIVKKITENTGLPKNICSLQCMEPLLSSWFPYIEGAQHFTAAPLFITGFWMIGFGGILDNVFRAAAKKLAKVVEGADIDVAPLS